jgi:hypothetical protein
VGAGQVAGSLQTNFAPCCRAGRPGGGALGREPEVAVAAQADEQGHGRAREGVREARGVVPGVAEDERRRLPRRGRALSHERPQLLDRHRGRLLLRPHAPHVERRRPAIARRAEPRRPLVGPPGYRRVAPAPPTAGRVVLVALLACSGLVAASARGQTLTSTAYTGGPSGGGWRRTSARRASTWTCPRRSAAYTLPQPRRCPDARRRWGSDGHAPAVRSASSSSNRASRRRPRPAYTPARHARRAATSSLAIAAWCRTPGRRRRPGRLQPPPSYEARRKVLRRAQRRNRTG